MSLVCLEHSKESLPCMACFWIKLIVPKFGKENVHVCLNLLQVGQHIGALLVVDS